MTTPHRHRFRFGLRTLFVVVTVFACWLGYHANWLWQRNRYLDLFPTRGFTAQQLDRRAAPWPLNVVGAKGARDMIWIAVADTTTLEGQEEIQRVLRLFPEAKGAFSHSC